MKHIILARVFTLTRPINEQAQGGWGGEGGGGDVVSTQTGVTGSMPSSNIQRPGYSYHRPSG